MSIEIVVVELVVSICLGFLGAPVRMFAQIINKKPIDTSASMVFAKGFISAVAGLIYYLVTGWGVSDLRIIALGALIAGYTGVDFVENTLGDKTS